MVIKHTYGHVKTCMTKNHMTRSKHVPYAWKTSYYSKHKVDGPFGTRCLGNLLSLKEVAYSPHFRFPSISVCMRALNPLPRPR